MLSFHPLLPLSSLLPLSFLPPPSCPFFPPFPLLSPLPALFSPPFLPCYLPLIPPRHVPSRRAAAPRVAALLRGCESSCATCQPTRQAIQARHMQIMHVRHTSACMHVPPPQPTTHTHPPTRHMACDICISCSHAIQVYLSSSGVKHRFFMVQVRVRPSNAFAEV